MSKPFDPYAGWRVGDGEMPLAASPTQIIAPTPGERHDMIAATFNHNFEELSALRCARAVTCVNALAGRDPAKLGELEKAVAAYIDADPMVKGEAFRDMQNALAAFRAKQEDNA